MLFPTGATGIPTLALAYILVGGIAEWLATGNKRQRTADVTSSPLTPLTPLTPLPPVRFERAG